MFGLLIVMIGLCHLVYCICFVCCFVDLRFEWICLTLGEACGLRCLVLLRFVYLFISLIGSVYYVWFSLVRFVAIVGLPLQPRCYA